MGTEALERILEFRAQLNNEDIDYILRGTHD